MCGLGAAAPHAGGLVLAGGAVCGVELPFCPSQEGSAVAVLSHGRPASPAAPHLLRALPPAVAVPGRRPCGCSGSALPGGG